MEGPRSKVPDLKFELTDPLTRVRESPAVVMRIDAAAPIILPKFNARPMPANHTPPFVLPARPIEAPRVSLLSPYTVDQQDTMWIHRTNAQRASRGDPSITHADFEATFTELEESMHKSRQMTFPSHDGDAIGEYWKRKRRRRETDMHPLGYPCIEEYARSPTEELWDLPFVRRSDVTRYALEKVIPPGGTAPRSDKDVLVDLRQDLDVMVSALELLCQRERVKSRLVSIDLYTLATAREAALSSHAHSDNVSGVNIVGGSYVFSSMRHTMMALAHRVKP